MDERRDTRVIGTLVPSSPDPEPATIVRDALRLHHEGADLVDLDTMPDGPFAAVGAASLALLIRGISEAGVPVAVTTTRAAIARVALERGARWILDPSGTTADPEMIRVAARPSFAGWAIGPWSGATQAGAGDGPDAYMYGLVRNLAALLAAGVRSERIVLNASAGLAADSTDSWLMVGELERVRALGYPVLVDGRDEMLATMTSDESPAHLGDAAVGLAVLAVGARAWAIRTRQVGRVAETVGRMLEPRRSA